MFFHLDTWAFVLTLTCQAGSVLEVQPRLHTSSEVLFCGKLSLWDRVNKPQILALYHSPFPPAHRVFGSWERREAEPIVP